MQSPLAKGAIMRSSSRVRAVVGSAVLLFAASAGVAGAVTSYHGSDYSQDYTGPFGPSTGFKTCDMESDNNKTKGGYATSPTGSEVGSVGDNDGANGVCASTSSAAKIRRHHTCEKNLLSWDCDNWQATS